MEMFLIESNPGGGCGADPLGRSGETLTRFVVVFLLFLLCIFLFWQILHFLHFCVFCVFFVFFFKLPF